MKRLALIASSLATSTIFVSTIVSSEVTAAPGNSSLIYVDQGPKWTDVSRVDFYSANQGSQLMPLSWILALKTGDGHPFMSDSLARYGYLPNPASSADMPVGFTVSGPAGSQVIGMTCAACHTRQIEAGGQSYRIDGGPAIVDFQAFLTDLMAATNRVLATDAAFDQFAVEVLGSGATSAQKAALKAAVALWYQREGTLMSKALPSDPWGLGRLDAVSMIFNRLSALDLGPPPSYMIADNVQVADAPVRYPFLWNAPIQDKTQWPGFADNGSDILGLARNLGEVYGVFGVYRPKNQWWHLAGINFLDGNSANFDGLNHLESLVRQIGAPKWPWPIDLTRAAQGKSIFERSTAAGGCADCHAERPGVTRFPLQKTWATPVMDVGTDSRQYSILTRTADSGVLAGAEIPFLVPKIKQTDTAFNLLAISVVGSIVQNYTTFSATSANAAMTKSQAQKALETAAPPTASNQELKGAFSLTATPGSYAYESRVLEGIWAAAPYLHNGSVASLAELLKPSNQRQASFAVGPQYDTTAVGLAADQGTSPYVRNTTGCDQRDSGNSHCGHEFGTALSDDEKQALLEYLKTL